MPWYIVAYLVAAFMAAALNLLLALFTWRNREAPGASSFTALLGLIAFWSILTALQVLSSTWRISNIWRSLQFVSLAFAPVALLTFVIQYLGWGRWLKPWRWWGLCLIPIITQIACWVDFVARWTENTQLSFGWFIVHAVYSFVLIFIAILLMLISVLRTRGYKRRQMLYILLGISLPVGINILITFRVIVATVDLTPLVFTLTALLFAWALYRQRLFEISPLARDVVIEGLQDAMLVLDTHGRIVDYNPAAQRTLHVNDIRRDGDIVAQRLPPWDVLQVHLASATPDTALEWEIVVAGVERCHEIHVTPLYGRQELLVGYVLLLRDITERKQAEAAIRQYAHDLETRNAELDAFAHTVAHDLKTPLTSLIGFSALLHKRVERWTPEQVSENAARIHQTGLRMQGIIEELLLLASVRKAQAAHLGPLDMGRIVATALERLETQIAEQQAVIRQPSTWPTVNGYAPWVVEIWVNYISNALKYGGQPPEVELGYTRLDSEALSQFSKIQNSKSGIIFWVHDNGPGLSAAAQQQLFVEFTRLEQGRAEGHGLGLSIVFRIAQKLDGEVGVVSAEGTGSTFWFSLPIA